MVCPGQECKTVYTPEQIASATVAVLQRTVPPAVPGVTFLSGGQSEEAATVNLDAINRCPGRKPWRLTFSYARALQSSVIKAWKGQPGSVRAAQDLLVTRAEANSAAARGQYVRGGGAAGDTAAESLFVRDYRY